MTFYTCLDRTILTVFTGVFRKSTHFKEVILYSRKYWRSLNLAVWPQTMHKKYWRNLNLAVVPHSILCHYKHCERVEERVYQGALPTSRLRYLNQIYKKYNWQRVTDELAICTACKTRHWAGPRALQHVLHLTRNIGGF